LPAFDTSQSSGGLHHRQILRYRSFGPT
jgi:hypothetical protein